ncbi:MAG: V-type ATP synthase subunit I [Planctomycetota bacterium]|jgi:V/A-type H+-transporting ATPase subunit I
MIVPMSKVHVVTQGHSRDRLLEALAALGVVHVEPIDPAKAVAKELTLHAISALGHAQQILQGLRPAGDTPNVCPLEAAREAISIHKAIADEKDRLNTLYRTADQLELWGNTELKQLEELRSQGIEIKFFSAAQKDLVGLEAECIETVAELSGQEVATAVIDRTGKFQAPEGAKEIPWPTIDLPTVRKEAAEVDATLKRHNARLAELANLIETIHHLQKQYQTEADFCVIQNSGLSSEALFALQGWAPSQKAESLSDNLGERDITAAVEVMSPDEDEQPPTLIEYPDWAKPIKGLFDMLGTVAGYREFDVSIPFMLALPIFAAMLIGDGGYGAVLFIGLLLGYKKASSALGRNFTQLLIIVGAASLLWGFLCGSFFGFVLYKPPIPVNMTDTSRFMLMQISFVMGAIHLSIAQLWQAFKIFPDLRFLNKVGWAIFVWGMLGVVQMFVLSAEITWSTPWPYLLIAGTVLTVLFDSPSKNIFKMVLLGIANYPLSMLGAFSDIISYVRLMAVGLASGVLASSFNDLALNSGSWLIAGPTLIFGHSLNLGLAMIALFAHGVRLNMLEFSNNLGMQWIGCSYKPFSRNNSGVK